MTTPEDRRDDDPTLMRNQPALSTSNGTIWLGIGAVLTVIVVAVLVPLVTVSAVIAGTGIALVLVLFLGLLIARFRMPAGRSRLVMLASLFVGIAVVGLLAVFLISSLQAEMAS